MVMTNYMDLLAANQPWNLILFMVIPVALAEALVATEFYTVYHKDKAGSRWQQWNRRLGIAAGIYFSGVVVYLLTHVVPFLEWRGTADIAAVLFYLLGVVPLLGIALLELGFWGRSLSVSRRTHSHFMLLIGFLVVSHLAMVLGMLDPQVTGWRPAEAAQVQEMTMDGTMEMPAHGMTGSSAAHSGHAGMDHSR